MSRIPAQCLVSQMIFKDPSWDETRPEIQQYVAGIALPCVLYGIFVSLCGASIYSLLQLNNRNRQTTLVLSFALLALFGSTTIYTITMCIQMLEHIYNEVLSGYELWDYFPFRPDMEGYPWSTGDNSIHFVPCGPTVALTINIFLGDAIVCWRACVVWQGNRLVLGTCIILLLTTFALGTGDTVFACQPSQNGRFTSWEPDSHANGNGSLYSGFSYGLASTALSLSTNLFATVAVMVKAWRSRRALQPYIVAGPRASQVQKLLSLLIESGIVYCALWVMVLTWQAGFYTGLAQDSGASFWNIWNVIVNDALVPLIAIYPTVIIVIVALNRSHLEKGFTGPTLSSVERLPLPRLTVTVNDTAEVCSDNTHCPSQPKDGASQVGDVVLEEYWSEGVPGGSSTHLIEKEVLDKIV